MHTRGSTPLRRKNSMKQQYSTENLKRANTRAAPRQPSLPLSRLFKSWLALGLLLNLIVGQLQLPIGPLWLWLVLIPALCALAVPGVLMDFMRIKLRQLSRFGSARRRAQATRRPITQ